MLLAISLAFIPLLLASFPRNDNPGSGVRSFPIFEYEVVQTEAAYVFHDESFRDHSQNYMNLALDSLDAPIEQPRSHLVKRRRGSITEDGRNSKRFKRHASILWLKPTAFQESGQVAVIDNTLFMFPRNVSKIFTPPKFEPIDSDTLLPKQNTADK